jgi:hypothetical protein
MRNFLNLVLFLIFIVGYSNSQVKVPISEDGVVKYSFDYSVKDSKFCISKLFSPENSSEYSILMQKTATIVSVMSWNEAITKKLSVTAAFIPQSQKNLKCNDTTVLNPNSLYFNIFSRKPNFKLKIKGKTVYGNFLQVRLNVKIFFKNKTDFTIVISDIYVTYSVLEKMRPISKRLELGELYNDKVLETKKDKNRLLILELLDNAAKNTANSLNQAIKESVTFLN